MKTVTIKGIMADFLDSIREYEHESGKAIHYDERESSEFVDMYFNGGGKIKIEEKKPLFVTKDGVKVFDRNTIIYNVRNNTLAKIKINADYFTKYDFEHKVFYHESNADEYILMNKPVFSYNDIKKFQSGGEGICYDLKAIAKERIDNGK